MASFIEQFENAINKIITIFTWISGLTIFAMMFLISCDVIARYFFENPIKGTIDLGEMALVIVGFLGMAYTQAEKGHVRIEVLISRLSETRQSILDTAISLFSAFIFGMIAIQMARKGVHILVSDEVGPVTNLLFIPHFPFFFIGAAGCLLFSLRLMLDARTNFTRFRLLKNTRIKGS